MTRTNLSIAALALVATLALPVAASAQTVEEATWRIEIMWDGAGHSFRIENRSYRVLQLFREGKQRTLLLDQSVVGTQTTYQDGCCGFVVRVVAQVVNPDTSLTPAWELEVEAHTGEPRGLSSFGDAYVATHYGCCGTFTAEHYFSLATGEHLITANEPLAMLKISNSNELTRLAGVEVPWSVNWELFYERKDALGVLYYSSIDRQIDRVLIAVRDVDVTSTARFFAEPELRWISSNDTEAARELALQIPEGEQDFSNFTGVSLRVTYTPEAWVEIPLVADRLDLAAARLAPNLTLEPLP